MDIITAATMDTLTDREPEPAVSLYLPTHRFGPETRQGPIRLDNLLDRARGELVDLGMRGPDADDFLADARALESDDDFWQHQEDGLAVFVDGDATQTFRLPVDVDEFAMAADAFHLKPLWPLVSGDDLFHVLALSRGSIHLWWANRFQIGEIDLPSDIPTSLAEALWFDDPEKQLQYHGADRTGRGRVVATFHGHGVPEEKDDAKLDMFLRAVDGGLRHLLDADAPLVLAGVDDIVAQFRSVSDHRAIVDEHVGGNVEDDSADEIHADAVKLMQPRFDRVAGTDADAFLAAGDLAMAEPEAVAVAAARGRVETVFVPLGRHRWGRAAELVDEVVTRDEREPGDRDLFDVAATATWTHGGRVHAVDPEDVPGAGPLAATLRW
ncbi:MAG: hypothetical protein R3290_02350 [Acidimicrobiia bacterium]|nr:hypothetical protein [Acidimicrobiia bacterium]